MGERLRDNVPDGFWRSKLGEIARAADPGQDGLLNVRDLTQVRLAPLERELDRRFGEDRDGWFQPAPRTYETLGETMGTAQRQGLAGTEAARAERERRDRFDERAARDPVRNPGDALASFGGQVVGSAPSPENFAGGGAGKGLSLLPRVAVRVAEQGAIAGLVDVDQQLTAVASGIQDRFSPTQALVSAGVGGTLGPAVDFGAPVAARAVARGGRGTARFAGQLVSSAENFANSRVSNPLPSFDGQSMDAAPLSDGRPASNGVPNPVAAGERPPRRAAVRSPEPPVRPAFVAPVEGRVSSGYGPRTRPNARASANHQGIDYAVPEGSPVASAADGVVIFAGQRGNYGNRVVVRHGDGTETAYSHLSRFDVRVGDRVASGQPLARSGSTGNVTGPHLHFEVRQGGALVDPRLVLSGEAPAPGGPARAVSARAAPDTPIIRATTAPVERLSPPPEGRGSHTPEEMDAAREAILDPAAATRLRAMLTERLGSPRQARITARAMVHRARRDDPQTPRRLSDVDAEAEAGPVSRIAPDDNALSPGLEGFRVDVPGSQSNLFGAVSGDVRPDGTWRVRQAELPEQARGQGIAVAAYERAAREAHANGSRLTSDEEVTPAAVRVWEGLQRRGFGVERNPAATMQSRAGIPDTMGMGPESLRTPDGSPVFRVTEVAPGRSPADAATGSPAPRFGGQPVAARPARFGAPEKLAMQGANQTLRSSGQAASGLRGAPRPDAVARGAGTAFEGKTVSTLAADLRQALGLTHRQGRVGAKGALGTYNTGSGVVRTKAVDELDVLAHEATHALEYERKGPALAAALKAHGKHLETLAYPGAAQGVKRQEGFAEFGRWYLTNPDHARRLAPAFFDAFEQAMQADAPDVLSGMKAVQSGYQNLLSSSSIDVAAASIAYTGSRGPIGNLIDEVKRTGPGATLRRVVDDVYTAVIDDLHPLSIAERELSKLYLANNGQKLDLKRAASPYALARLSREGYAAGHTDLMNGVTPYRGLDPEGASLADALETAGLAKTATGKLRNEGLRELDAYLIARRAVHLWDRYAAGDLPNPPDRNTKAFHEQVIRDAEAANPTWEKAAGQVYEYLTNLWRKEFEAGLITRDAYENGLTHADYVPFNRDMSDKGVGGKGGKPRGALQFAGGVKQLEGSSRDIISPLSSIMRRTYELNAIIKRNDVMKALDDMAEAAGRGAGAIVERLPSKEIQAFTVKAADALQKTADELGLSGRDLSTMQKFADDAQADDLTITLFKPTEFSPRKGEAVVFVWKQGKKTPLLLPDGEFGQQMFTALAGMNKDLRNVVVEGMAAATQLLRYGVTLSPEFMAANIIRDSLATWINTDVGFVPGLDTIRGGAMELAQGQTANRYATAGGMRGGANTAATQKPFPKTDAEAEAQLQHLRRKGWKVKRFASWRGLAEATDLSETSTRLGVFKKGFDQAKRRGLTDYEALIESGFTSRDYLDFARRGSKMLTASRIVTFLNAAMQGLDKSARVLTAGGNLKGLLTPLSREARTSAEKLALGHAYKAWAKIMALGALGLGLRMLYADDSEYQEINDRLRATHWIANIGGRWIFVPKPFELATVSNILERGFEATTLKDPTAGERLLSDFRHTIAPPSEIPALAVPFHLAKNRDYLGRPIVADHLRGTVDPEMQFNSYTSDLGKLIGRTFNVSPAQVDYLVTGFGGSLGRYVLQGSNLIGEAITGRPRTAAGPEDMFLARRFTRQIDRGSESQAEFWDLVSKDGGEMTRAEGSFRAFLRDARDAEAAEYLNRLPPEQRAYVVAKVFSGEGESVVHPLVRTQNAIAVIGDFRRDVRSGDLRDGTGQVVAISPQQRRALDNALADFAMAEMRNALIGTGVDGWRQKEPMNPADALRRIGATSPAAFEQLSVQLQLGKAITAAHPDVQRQVDAMWQQARPALEGSTDPQRVIAMLRQKRGRTGDRSSRYAEAQRQAGGAYQQNALARPVAPPTRAPRFSGNALAQ